MKTTTQTHQTSGIKVLAGIRAGGLGLNHNRKVAGLKVKSAVKAGGLGLNHNRKLAR